MIELRISNEIVNEIDWVKWESMRIVIKQSIYFSIPTKTMKKENLITSKQMEKRKCILSFIISYCKPSS